jgi:phosphoribosylanthranilate isomerase
MTKVKICGMMKAEDIDVARLADYVGFVVASRSFRCLELPAAKDLMSIAEQRKVMVTTCHDPAMIVKMAGQLEPDVVQVHNLMGPADLRFITRKVSGQVWGLVPMGGGDEDERINRIRNAVNAAVLDTKSPAMGGFGMPHDWVVSRSLRNMVHPYPVVLAGGLDPENVQAAIHQVEPFCVDVSSGVETGCAKDPQMVRRFIRLAKGVKE